MPVALAGGAELANREVSVRLGEYRNGWLRGSVEAPGDEPKLAAASLETALDTDDQLNLLRRQLGYTFKDPGLLRRALTHVSYDRHKRGDHNEVLEFLGDAVLDLAVSDLLMQHNPDKTEGDLSRMRAALVNSTVLAEKAGELTLGALLRLGKGEERSEGRSKPSILAGAFEAILGAVYRDGGYEAARAP